MRYCIKKFPLLLKEGWSGRLIILYIQYFISRPGWLIHSFLLTFIDMKNKNLFNRKSLKFFRSSLRNKSTTAEAELWNILKSKKLNARKFRRQSTTPAGINICIIIKKWSGHPSFKRRGNVSDIYSILYILFCTKLSHYFTIFPFPCFLMCRIEFLCCEFPFIQVDPFKNHQVQIKYYFET